MAGDGTPSTLLVVDKMNAADEIAVSSIDM